MTEEIKRYDALVVGAGFAGIFALKRLTDLGLRVRVVEAGSDVGGTWYWNRYPGARCDTESMQYSYSFSEEVQQDWDWSELYASQPEILRYINYVVDRLDLRKHITFDTRVDATHFDEKNGEWSARLDNGEQVVARYCVMATGCLSVPKEPDIPGLDRFEGRVLRTSVWPEVEPDFANERVGLIGTGSSGIQTATTIAPKVGRLDVFQRTPNYSVPARNRDMSDGYVDAWKNEYSTRRERIRESRNYTLYNNPGQRSGHEVTPEQFERIMEMKWQVGGIGFMYAFSDITKDAKVNDAVASFVRRKIDETVKDPRKAEILKPHNYPIGAKRICVDTGYYEIYNRENVDIHDIKAHPIQSVTSDGVVLSDGERFEFDTIVLATGFDAMTGAINNIEIQGKQGAYLFDEWEAGPHTYLGLMVAGFPNLFLVTGPGSPSVFSNMVPSIEEHVNWIVDTIAMLEENGEHLIEPTQDAQRDWMEEVEQVSKRTLMRQADSWYLGANVEGKPRVFMPYVGGSPTYARILKQRTEDNYEGFERS